LEIGKKKRSKLGRGAGDTQLLIVVTPGAHVVLLNFRWACTVARSSEFAALHVGAGMAE